MKNERTLRSLTFTLLLANATGAAAQVDKMSTAAQYIECMKLRTDQLDDGKSDARSVAAAVYSACQSERRAHMRYTAGVDNTRAQQLMDVSREQDIDQVSAVVLQERAKRRGK